MNSEVRILQELRTYFLEVRILKRLVNVGRLPLSSGCEGCGQNYEEIERIL
jgi:hypothetical protein